MSEQCRIKSLFVVAFGILTFVSYCYSFSHKGWPLLPNFKAGWWEGERLVEISDQVIFLNFSFAFVVYGLLGWLGVITPGGCPGRSLETDKKAKKYMIALNIPALFFMSMAMYKFGTGSGHALWTLVLIYIFWEFFRPFKTKE